MAAIDNDWLEPLSGEFKKPYYRELYKKVKQEYETRQVFPDANDIFNAFAFTPLAEVKIVDLGQDPYIQCGSGPWPVFFRQTGCGDPAVPGQYLSGAS